MQPRRVPSARRFERGSDDPAAAALAALAEAVQVRDGATAQHSVTVGRLCGATAAALGLDSARVSEVEVAGCLHDLGKVGLPDSILHKPGPLTEEEWLQMQRHPEIGAHIVATAGLGDVSQWIMLHHERPDGGGYPHGLDGDSIPLEAAIVAAADAYEAMVTDRVYRPALSEAEARAELGAAAGAQFDSRVVEALLDVAAGSASCA